MPRYYFDLNDGGRETDQIGIQLSDDEAAQRMAIRFAGEVLIGEPRRLDHGPMQVLVRKDGRANCFSVEIALRRD